MPNVNSKRPNQADKIAKGRDAAGDDRLVEIHEASSLFGLSVSSIYRFMKEPPEGRPFPKGQIVGKRGRRWRLGDIKQYVAG